jgi:hypothetical protein
VSTRAALAVLTRPSRDALLLSPACRSLAPLGARNRPPTGSRRRRRSPPGRARAEPLIMRESGSCTRTGRRGLPGVHRDPAPGLPGRRGALRHRDDQGFGQGRPRVAILSREPAPALALGTLVAQVAHRRDDAVPRNCAATCRRRGQASPSRPQSCHRSSRYAVFAGAPPITPAGVTPGYPSERRRCAWPPAPSPAQRRICTCPSSMRMRRSRSSRLITSRRQPRRRRLSH